MLRKLGFSCLLKAVACLLPLLCSQPGRATSLQQYERELSNLYQRHKDAVVKVKVASKFVDGEGNDQISLTVLTGFYISSTGIVLTNSIPMQDGHRIRVEKDGLQRLAIPLGTDPRSNLGLLQVVKPDTDLHYIDISQIPENPSIGSLAIAIASPLDFEPTPNIGYVTGNESQFSDISFPVTYIRVSIPSGPAEGGSPVFNSQGQLIGISVASLPDVNSSYLLPSHALARIVDQLKAKKTYPHSTIDADFSERPSPDKQDKAVVVSSISSRSSAYLDGLREGDQILRFGSREIRSMNEFRDALFLSSPGDTVILRITRADQEIEIALLIEPEPET